MAEKVKYKRGDLIVDKGRVYKIFKVRKKKDEEGEEQRIIFYRPHFKNKKNETLEISIPAENIEESEIRKLVSEERMDEALESLEELFDLDKRLNIKSAKAVLGGNDFDETVEMLRKSWADKENEEVNFTTSKRRVFRRLKKRVAAEMASINDISLNEAQKRINAALSEAKEEEEEE